VAIPARLALEIFPPYFVAGAIFSASRGADRWPSTIRAAYGLHDSSRKHLDNMAKVLLATGLMCVTAT